MGELHLEIIVDRLMREFKVDANVGKPQVAYRETPQARHEGRGQVRPPDRWFRPVRRRDLNVEPNEPGKGFEFENKITGGSIPKEYIRLDRAGVKEAMESGMLAGYPMVDVKVELTDGKYHEVDSSEMAFEIAGSIGFKEAAQRAQAPSCSSRSRRRGRHARGVHGRSDGRHLGRRGRIEGMEQRGNAQIVRRTRPAF